MDCPHCGVPMVAFDVPSALREHAPATASAAAICPECLSLVAADAADAEPRFDRISDAFPAEERAAVPMALAVGLLDSLALHRGSIETLLAAVEEAGVDPLLLLDRLDAQGGVQPTFDIRRRRHQLEQLRD